MRFFKWALLYSLLVWMIPFVIAFLIFPLRNSDRDFFESIMPVAVVLATVIFSGLYFKKVHHEYLKEGLLLGVIFLLVNLVFDLAMFSQGPWAMPLGKYIKDIGFTYLMIPIITVGFGAALQKKQK